MELHKIKRSRKFSKFIIFSRLNGLIWIPYSHKKAGMAKVERQRSGEPGTLDSYRNESHSGGDRHYHSSSRYSSHDGDKQAFLDQLGVRSKNRENVNRFKRSLWVKSPSPPLLTSDSDQEPSLVVAIYATFSILRPYSILERKIFKSNCFFF